MIECVVGVIVWTEDMQRLLGFYRDVLCLKLHSQSENFAAFKFGEIRLSLGKHQQVKGRSQDSYRIMINLGTAGIHQEYQRLLSQGVEFIRKPVQEHWGGWVATCFDPDGNVLQLLQQPS